MPWENVARCDVCGAVKGDANKWLLVDVPPKGDLAPPIPAFVVYHWHDDIAHGPAMKILCGESCLGKLLQPFLDQRSTIPTTEDSPV